MPFLVSSMGVRAHAISASPRGPRAGEPRVGLGPAASTARFASYAVAVLVCAGAAVVAAACRATCCALSWLARRVNAAGLKSLITLAIPSILLMSWLLNPSASSAIFRVRNCFSLFATVVAGAAVGGTVTSAVAALVVAGVASTAATAGASRASAAAENSED